MATIDHLIADLQGEGAVESEGQFTLDREQARAKMQKFQLADARRYVLELVQAAVLRGATAIAFEIDADDMRVGFDGEPFTARELDDLYGSLFRDGEGRALEGLRQLALALNAALGMGPKFITLRSGAVHLRMVPGRDDEITTLEDDAVEVGTQIHVKQRLRARVMLDFFKNLAGRLGEEQYLRERCVYARAAITLDGKPISHGPQPPAQHFTTLERSGEGYHVLMAATDTLDHTQLRLVKSGVWIDTLTLPGSGSHILAIAEGEQLRKDVSQTQIVRDSALGDITDVVHAARWQVWAKAKAEAIAQAESGDAFLPTRVSELIQSLILFHAQAKALRGDPHGLELAEGVRWNDCRDLSHSISLRELLALDEDAAIRWSPEHFPELEREQPPILHLPVEHDRTMLARLLGDRLVECSDLLRRAKLREQHRQAWLEREGDPVLPTHVEVLSSGPLRVTEGPLQLRGEVSIDRETLTAHEHPVHMMLYKRRRLLGRLELDLDLPNVWLIVDAEFDPTEDYRDAVRNSVFVNALLRALAALRQPLAKLLYDARGQSHEPRARHLAKRWLTSLLVPRAQASMLASSGADVTPGFYLSPSELLPELLAPEPALGRAWDCLVAQPLFRQHHGPDLSLHELALRVEAEGELVYLPGPPPDPRVEATGVALLGSGDQEILRALFSARFGEDPLRELDIGPQLRRLRHSDQAPYRWKDRLHPQLASTGIQTGTWHLEPRDLGVVLLVAYADLGYRLEDLDEQALTTTKLIALVDQRVLCTLEVDLGFGPLIAVVEDPRLRADPSWEGVVRDADFDGLIEELRICAHTLFRQLCEGYLRELSSVQAWLARVLLHAAASAEVREQHWLPGSGLAALPILDTIAGGRLSLDEVLTIAAAHGQVDAVGRDTSWTPVKDPEILKLDADEAEELCALLSIQLGEGYTRIRHRAAFAKLEGRPAMTEAAIDPASVFSVRALEHGLTGEIGIARARREPGLCVRIGVAGRLVQTLERHTMGVWLPLEAAVIDDELPLTSEGEPDTRSKRYRALLRNLRRCAAKLIEDLCGSWAQLDATSQAEAWKILMMHLESEADIERGKARDIAYARALEVPGFRDAWGRRYSLGELIERGNKQPLRALARLRPAVPTVSGMPVLLLSQAEIDCLEDGFDLDVELIDARWDEHIAWLEGLANAPKIERPDFRKAAIIHRKVQAAGGISCDLWLPLEFSPLLAGAPVPELIVDHDGHAVASMTLLDTLPCAGLLSGPGLAAHSGQLDDRQRVGLIRQILILYIALAEDLRAGKLRGARHTKALEYMAWIDMCVDYGVTELEDLGSDRKRAKQLVYLASELTPPTLRESLRRSLADAQGEDEDVTVPVIDPSRVEPEPKPEPAPPPEQVEPEPAPAPARGEPEPPKPPGAHERLISAVYEQLHWARERHGQLLDELRLSRIELRLLDSANIAEIHLAGVMLNLGHPIIARLLAQPRHDLIDLSFVVAAVYTAMNDLAEDISDDDERLFVGQLAESLALALRV